MEAFLNMLVLAAILGLVPGFIANSKGRSFLLWWFYGFMLFIVALVHSILLSPDRKTLEDRQISEGMKKCPHCAELVQGGARVCRFCNHEIVIPTLVEKNISYKKELL